MTRLLVSIAIGTLLVSCTPMQISTAQQDQAKVQASLNSACADVAAAEALVGVAGALPAVNNIEAYANSACTGAIATSTIVSIALNDPTTVGWVENLAAQLKALAPKS